MKLLVKWEDPDMKLVRPEQILDGAAKDVMYGADDGGYLDNYENKSREELCAFFRQKTKGRFAQPADANPRSPRVALARDARHVRCGNCGAIGHISSKPGRAPSPRLIQL